MLSDDLLHNKPLGINDNRHRYVNLPLAKKMFSGSFLFQWWCWSHLLVAACLATPPIPNLTTDQSALLTFKAHITHNDVLMHNWSSPTSCCSWIGVTCGVRHRRVTALNLSYMGLNGTIPPHLGNLSFLASLDLRNNSFQGHLPDELGFMHRLRLLSLTYNNFTGELPLSFGNLTKLQFLYLQQNQLHGQLPLSIYKCTQLKILSLSYNRFTKSIPKEIGNLTTLKVLELGGNNFEGVIPKEMVNLVDLEILDMQYNSLTGSIPREIGNLTMLKELRLSTNKLEGTIPRQIGNLISITVIDLKENSLEGIIPKEIGNLTLIKEIQFGNNNLKGVIPQEMGNFNTLEVLDLELNGLTGPIPFNIFNISTIEVIALQSNWFSGKLPSTIGLSLPNLEEIYLWGNELGGVIPTSITNASKLTVLLLNANSFTGFVPNTLGELRLLEQFIVGENFLNMEPSTLELRFLTSLTNCQYLTHVAFNNNPLGGILPISIGNLSASLQYLYANDCKIRGNIPREIGNLSNLIDLGLNNNEFTGSIPTTIGRLQNLQALDAQRNRLQGSIPYDICNLKSLGVLSLDGNNLSGSIPTCMNNLTSLRYLHLGSNKLSSIIPLTLWSLSYILQLNLSTNSLSGYLVVDVGNLKVVQSIDFSRNQLSGDIPSSIGGLQNLVSLNLTCNRLQGQIPQSFGNLISLEFLDISNNNLSGVIPKSFNGLRYLKYLNLSSNRLEGEIPNEGPFAKFSAPSFMMNHALCGAARLQVPPCKTNTPQRSRRAVVPLLKYILPATASVVLLVALISVLIRRRKVHVTSPSQADLSPIPRRRFSHHELLHATNGFCESNLIGIGSYGSVYRGMLSNGVNVAVKVFNLQLEGAFKSFETECEVLRSIRHRNLIKIISSCANFDIKCLVLEYMPNGSLEKWLYSSNYFLDILHRLNIMMDVASALEYLHHGYSTLILHCDLKPNNVLLDEDMVAHVGDFGIAKLLGEEESMRHTKTLSTIGYMAPEYGSEGVVSSRSDVYSFGILMMETFTRKKPTDDMFFGEMSLKCWVKDSIPHAVTEVADANLLRENEEHFATKKKSISVILELALECSGDVPETRLGMKEILAKLSKIKSNFQTGVVGTRRV